MYIQLCHGSERYVPSPTYLGTVTTVFIRLGSISQTANKMVSICGHGCDRAYAQAWLFSQSTY
ncbi:hypothetical protein SERLADRAFT_398780 [Serpula lacrymans var. lacrymans S7.9]|uniref:Uncharacterized protein n=1 Tax=Serpula lacrymans var. lacrymans (strain S7.9) TaxID=578457 RepID=F8P728_SERL9|nr:uncharacterized protein SERLADRAFT_398780 [Serpula lacrymans var. lacrymans S7.9]EGO21244.1 hypothetical protein SERLADRAFT_398780 [Serpula lacrymans var. lacrymans S7.9]